VSWDALASSQPGESGQQVKFPGVVRALVFKQRKQRVLSPTVTCLACIGVYAKM
jgi:hypothetical protein